MSIRILLLLIATIAQSLAGIFPAQRAHRPLAASRSRDVSGRVPQSQTPAHPTEPLAASQANDDRIIDTQHVTECHGTFCRQVTYHWTERPTDPGRLFLFRDGTQIGGWHTAARLYLDYNAAANTWGNVWQDCPPAPVPEPRPSDLVPQALPRGQAPPLTQQHAANGIRRDHMDPPSAEEKFTGPSGEKLHRRHAERLLGAIGDPTKPKLVDDSALNVLTVIGTEPEQKKVLADFDASPALAEFKGTLLINAMTPNQWQLEPGFVTTGKPTIYVQGADGKVLHRQDDYDGGAPELAKALRRARPDYDPKKDPDLRKLKLPDPTPEPTPTPTPTPNPAPAPTPANPMNWLAALIAAIAAIILIRKRSSN